MYCIVHTYNECTCTTALMHKDKGVTYLWFSLSWQRYIWPYKTSLRMAHSSTTHDQLTELDEICFNFWQHFTIFLLTLPHTIPIDFKIWGKIIRERKDIMPINNWCWQLPFGYTKSQKVSTGFRWFETNYITRRFLYCSNEKIFLMRLLNDSWHSIIY